MASPQVFDLVWGPLSCHAFNKDATQVALAQANNVLIFSKSSTGWTLEDTLTEHDKTVTCIDWAPQSNRIVTCSQDRNAYVWTWDGAHWKPTLVLLRINRAATFVRWSPAETKFAVASGARLISVCYFEQENDWWISKHIKKPIKSTVLSLDWHPEGILLAAGSSDMKARVFSAWIKGIDAKASNPVWGEKLPFGTLCGEFSSNGWVHAIAFSPQGTAVAWVAHDSCVYIATGPNDIVHCVPTNVLPFTSLLFASETSIIAAGHDCAPYLLQYENEWKMIEKLDASDQKKLVADNSAFNKFKQMDSKNQTTENDTTLSTIHQNTITCLMEIKSVNGSLTQFSSSGADGKLVIWTLLSNQMKGLKLNKW